MSSESAGIRRVPGSFTRVPTLCALILCGSALAFLAVAQDSKTPAAPNSRWTVQYFYDVDRSDLELTDLAFPSALRGIAIGTIYDKLEEKKPKYTALVTSDGGAQWSLVPLKEFPMFRAGAPYFFDWLAHPSLDSYWRKLSIEEHHPKVTVPALNIGGWYDIFQGGTLRNFLGMRARGA